MRAASAYGSTTRSRARHRPSTSASIPAAGSAVGPLERGAEFSAARLGARSRAAMRLRRQSPGSSAVSPATSLSSSAPQSAHLCCSNRRRPRERTGTAGEQVAGATIRRPAMRGHGATRNSAAAGSRCSDFEPSRAAPLVTSTACPCPMPGSMQWPQLARTNGHAAAGYPQAALRADGLRSCVASIALLRCVLHLGRNEQPRRTATSRWRGVSIRGCGGWI